MPQKNSPIQTKVGFVTGRDAIYLHKINLLSETEVCIAGELMGNNCSKLGTDYEVKFSLTFKGMLLFNMCELDFDDTEYESCFDLIEDSEKLAKLRAVDKAAFIGKMDRGYDENGQFSDKIYHQHFVLHTYDTVFEIIAQSYNLVIEI